jgi:hypothetical protein
MKHTEFFSHKMVSPDGKAIAEIQSMVSDTDNNQSKISQSVSIQVYCNGFFNSSSSSVSGTVSVSSHQVNVQPKK